MVEGGLSKISGLEEDMAIVKVDLLRALKTKEPVVTQEDYDKWNANCDKTDNLEDIINNLIRDFKAADFTKI